MTKDHTHLPVAQVRELITDVLGTVRLELQDKIKGPAVGQAVVCAQQRADDLLANAVSLNPPIRFWTDGGMLGGKNPSTEGVYWSTFRALPSGVSGLVIVREKSREHFTNNEAEWLALRATLRFARQFHPQEHIQIYSDSQLIVNQFNGRWRCQNPRLIRFAHQCWDIAPHFPQCVVSWQPRKEMLKRLGH